MRIELRLKARSHDLSCPRTIRTGSRWWDSSAHERALGEAWACETTSPCEGVDSVVSTTDRRDCGHLSCDSVLGGFALRSRGRAPQQAPVILAWTSCQRALQRHCIARRVLKPTLQAGQQNDYRIEGHLPGRHPGGGSAKASTGTVPIPPGRLVKAPTTGRVGWQHRHCGSGRDSLN